jgi:hypothetical protein
VIFHCNVVFQKLIDCTPPGFELARSDQRQGSRCSCAVDKSMQAKGTRAAKWIDESISPRPSEAVGLSKIDDQRRCWSGSGVRSLFAAGRDDDGSRLPDTAKSCFASLTVACVPASKAGGRAFAIVKMVEAPESLFFSTSPSTLFYSFFRAIVCDPELDARLLLSYFSFPTASLEHSSAGLRSIAVVTTSLNCTTTTIRRGSRARRTFLLTSSIAPSLSGQHSHFTYHTPPLSEQRRR